MLLIGLPIDRYVGGRAAEAFKKPFVEYKQANLVYPERVEEVFTPPPGQPPFDIVFDLTGEVRINRNDDVSCTAVAPLICPPSVCKRAGQALQLLP